MALFFDTKIQRPENDTGTTTHLAWHNNYPILAVAATEDRAGVVGCTVRFYLDEGEHVETASISNPFLVSAIKWHPLRKVLGMGWDTGTISLWNEHEHFLHEDTSVHKARIRFLEWNSLGTRLISGDEDGVVGVWRADQRGRITPMCQYRKAGAMTHCVFRALISDKLDLSASLAEAGAFSRINGADGQGGADASWRRAQRTNPGGIAGGMAGAAGGRNPLPPAECPPFFFGGEKGIVYLADDCGQCIEAFMVGEPLQQLLFYDGRDVVLAITKSMMLSQHVVPRDGKPYKLMEVKLSMGPTPSDIIWAGMGLLATASGESKIRVWDLEKDDNYVLSLAAHSGFNDSCHIQCAAYCPMKGILAAGTNKGQVVMWRFVGWDMNSSRDDGRSCWEFLPPSDVGGNVRQVSWGSRRNLLAANMHDMIKILDEHVMVHHFRDGVGAVQTTPSRLAIERHGFATDAEVKSEMHIKGVYVTRDNIAIWNGKQVETFELAQEPPIVRPLGSFASTSQSFAVSDSSIFIGEAGKVQVCTFNGTPKQTLTLSEAEGDPIFIDAIKGYIVVATSHGFVRVYDISRREVRPHTVGKNILEAVTGAGSVISARINCAGTRVSILTTKPSLSAASGLADSRIHVWDVESDALFSFDFGPTGRVPLRHYWDPHETKVLIIEARPLHPGLGVDTEIATIFASPESGGLFMQPGNALEPGFDCLLGVELPFLFFARRASGDTQPGQRLVVGRPIRDFVGLEDCDAGTRSAMVDFSFHMTVGNMDEAFKAVKLIKSGSVWENMARMCVKTKRLDVAALCLGHMGNAAGAKALREAMKEPELDARVASLAVHVGFLDEAERLYISCGRYDLLNKFYQAGGQWEKAIAIASKNDRINLRGTCYAFGKFLEASGEISRAIDMYERSETHRFEVPRMLSDRPVELEAYVNRSSDPQLRKWWAQFAESAGEMDTAMQYYESARDHLSVVRVYCLCGNLEKANEIANDTEDPLACYHLAQQYEAQEDFRQAVRYFSRARCFNHAIRLAKEHQMDHEVMNLALQAQPEDMLDAARYYEAKQGMTDKAIVLYHRAGEISRALDMCFRTQQFDALRQIAEDLDERTDPETVNRCAAFFIEHQQYEKAVQLMLVAKKHEDAIGMCLDHAIPITEDMAERMSTPPSAKDGKESEADTAVRQKLLLRIGDACLQQRSYHLACKKFTQAGDKVQAMKALLKSGDTEKIVFFAGVSRNKDIYVMAANYLQTLDWRSDPEIMKNIIGFYTKGRALDSLAGFYDACAQVEIDEYQNYEKALGALKESFKCMTKAKMRDPAEQEAAVATLQNRIHLVNKFVAARKLGATDPDEMVRQCQVLLEEPDLESAVRAGDVYGLLIEFSASRNDFRRAYALLETMRQRLPNVNAAYFIDVNTLEAIHREVGVPMKRQGETPRAQPQQQMQMPRPTTAQSRRGYDDDDDIREDIDER